MPTLVSLEGASEVTNSAGAVAGMVAYAAGGTMFALTGFNNGATTYIQLHDAKTTPADTAVPLIILTAAADSHFYLEFVNGRKFQNGIYVCSSSTDVTKTITAAQCVFDVTYAART